jgi:hypothetical protein
MRYAENTVVPVERSKAEIEGLLIRYGATQFASGWSDGKATIGFKMNDRLIRFDLPLPRKDEKQFTHRKPRASWREPQKLPEETAVKLWSQACRSAWRALTLVVKAKLEAVAGGITTFEQEWGMFVVMPNGRTVGEMISPEIASAYASGKAPRLLLTAGAEA